ncbi:MAG: adenylate/guanylate cyclase domain-containing protein [Bdellovibrionota bacterium]
MSEKKEKSDAHDALDVNIDASTRTIKAQFRLKAKALQSGKAGVPASKKTFQELNEAYQSLIQNRQNHQGVASKTVTILSADVAEYSRMMATNEKETLEFFNFCKEVFEEIVDNNKGRVFNTAGDSILAEFEYVFSAIHCAVEIQRELRAINLGQPEGRKVQFRMGLHQGEVFMQGGDLLGDAVNVTARIQTAAKPGGICLSGTIYDLVSNKVSHSFTPLGKLTFKNIPEPVRTYALTEDTGTFKPPLPDAKIAPAALPLRPEKVKVAETKSGSSLGLILTVLILAVVGFFFWQSRHSAAPAPSAAPANNSAQLGHVFLYTTRFSNV